VRVTTVLLASALVLAGGDPVTPGPRDKCPVCGMFVAKYPDWLAGARLADGTVALFDGPKDLFKFWLDPGQFLPGRRAADLTAAFVTDYYTVRQLDAREAFFVLGSDVHGPMGRELVPFARREEAEEFRRDHRGTQVLRFDEVTASLVRSLDR
jgi:copper chaperone NosL